MQPGSHEQHEQHEQHEPHEPHEQGLLQNLKILQPSVRAKSSDSLALIIFIFAILSYGDGMASPP